MITRALLDTSKVIVGQSGSGKTVTAKDDVQQLLAEQRHLAIIDPTGVWWGLRSNPTGDGPAFDIPIFGGEHGDVPIRAVDGAAVARIIIEQRVSAIVDLSLIDNSRDWRIFVRDFVAELRKKPKANFHLIVDEADEFAQQQPVDDIAFALRENMVWMAKRGRVQGFVPTYITQRTAEIANAVISQAQTIVAHQLILPADQKVIDNYLKGAGSADVRKQVMGSLAELGVGERWIYSPRLKILERGMTPRLTTFDSSRTPEPGETLVEPRTLAQLDVTAIAAALAPPQSDPGIPADAAKAYEVGTAAGELLLERDRRIGELEQSLASLEESDSLELIVRDRRIEELEAIVADQKQKLDHLREADAECDGYSAGLTAIDELVRSIQDGSFRANLHPAHADSHEHEPLVIDLEWEPDAPPSAEPEVDELILPAAADMAGAPSSRIVPPRQQNLLAWLAWALAVYGGASVRRDLLAMLCGWHVRSKGFLNDLGELRSGRLIEYADGGGVVLTSTGLDAAGDGVAAPKTLASARHRIGQVLTPAQRQMLEYVTGAYPAAIERPRLAELVGQHVRTKSFLNNLGRLRGLGLVTYAPSGGVRTADFLMKRATE